MLRNPWIRSLGLAGLVAIFSGCNGCNDDPGPPPAASAGEAPPQYNPVVEPLPKPPRGLDEPPAPEGNPTTPEKAALGKQLFFDHRLSADGRFSCSSCHAPTNGFGGPQKVAPGYTRHAPSLWLVGYLPKLGWDGAWDSLESATRAMFESMAGEKKDVAARAKEIASVAGYEAQFKTIFPKRGVAPDTVIEALAAFQRTLLCGDSVYDKFAGGDAASLTDQQKAGLELFGGKAGCAGCHTLPFFSDAYAGEGGFHNTGIGHFAPNHPKLDLGRKTITQNDEDFGAFRTPTLRGIPGSGPYYHDGSMKVVDGVVVYMASGGRANQNLSKKMHSGKITPQEVQSIIDFLPTLACSQKVALPKLP